MRTLIHAAANIGGAKHGSSPHFFPFFSLAFLLFASSPEPIVYAGCITNLPETSCFNEFRCQSSF